MVLLILLAIALVIFLSWAAVNSSKMDQEEKERQERKKEYDSWKRNMETRWKAYDEARDAALAELETKWGKCDKDIYVTSGDVFSLEDRVYAFEKAEKIVLGGTVYDFKDIIGFSLVNKSKTVFNTYATVKSGKDPRGRFRSAKYRKCAQVRRKNTPPFCYKRYGNRDKRRLPPAYI